MPSGPAVKLSNGLSWPTKAAAEAHYRGVLDSLQDGQVVDDREHHDDLLALVERFDECVTLPGEPTKTGPGVDCFMRQPTFGTGLPEFGVRRIDGTEVGFSVTQALAFDNRVRSPSAEFYQACRAEVAKALMAAKRRAFDLHADKLGRVPCEITGRQVSFVEAHLDHAWPTFQHLVSRFRAARGWVRALPDDIVGVSTERHATTRFSDTDLAAAFRAFHQESAVLRIVDRQVNMRGTRGPREPAVRLPVRIPDAGVRSEFLAASRTHEGS